MIPVVVSARMTSQRLPGKSLRCIAAKPLLQWIIDNLRAIERQALITVATSIDESDDAIAAWCAAHEVVCYRGPLDNLAARLVQAARWLKADAFVRISGDSPFIDPAVVSYAIKLFEAGEIDLVTNVQMRTYPKGLSVEVIRTAALEHHIEQDGTKDDQEHVTTVLYRHAARVRIVNFTSGAPLGEVQLSVDTEDDFRLAEEVLIRSGGISSSMGWREIIDVLQLVQSLFSSRVQPC